MNGYGDDGGDAFADYEGHTDPDSWESGDYDDDSTGEIASGFSVTDLGEPDQPIDDDAPTNVDLKLGTKSGNSDEDELIEGADSPTAASHHGLMSDDLSIDWQMRHIRTANVERVGDAMLLQDEIRRSNRRWARRADAVWINIKARMARAGRSPDAKRRARFNKQCGKIRRSGVEANKAFAMTEAWELEQDVSKFSLMCLSVHGDKIGVSARILRKRVRGREDALQYVIDTLASDDGPENHDRAQVRGAVELFLGEGRRLPAFFEEIQRELDQDDDGARDRCGNPAKRTPT